VPKDHEEEGRGRTTDFANGTDGKKDRDRGRCRFRQGERSDRHGARKARETLAEWPQDHYRVDKTYAVAGVPGRTLFTAYSSYRYLLVLSDAKWGREQIFPMQLIKLPMDH
jgi:hypothetical protein